MLSSINRFRSFRSVTFDANCRVIIERFRRTKRFFSFRTHSAISGEHTSASWIYLAIRIFEARSSHVEFAVLGITFSELVQRQDIRRLKEHCFAQIICCPLIILRKQIQRSTFPVGEQSSLIWISDLLYKQTFAWTGSAVAQGELTFDFVVIRENLIEPCSNWFVAILRWLHILDARIKEFITITIKTFNIVLNSRDHDNIGVQ